MLPKWADQKKLDWVAFPQWPEGNSYGIPKMEENFQVCLWLI